jgi:predicted acylesterase/phospholipase RssA
VKKEGINKSPTTSNMKSFLALSGGGDRGCVLVGILDELHEIKGELEIGWDECAGISAGALTAAMVSQTNRATFGKMIKLLKSIFLQGGFHVVESWVYGGQVINMLDALLWHESIFQNTPMKNLVKQHFQDSKVQRPFSVGTYNKTLCRYESFSSTEEKNMANAILASAAVPVILPSVDIDSYKYEDGGMRHMLPIVEIEKWVKMTPGPKHVDVLMCFPVNNYKLFMKMCVPQTGYPIITNAVRTMSDVMLQTMENDLTRIGKLVNKSYEEITADNCGEWTNNNLTVRLLSPADGEFTSFIHMNPKSSMKLFESGARAVREYLTCQLKL